jgi:DNA-binding NarL/FixJ family response regulator
MHVGIIILDTHRVVRAGIKAMVGIDLELEVLAEAGSGFELGNLLRILKPDVVMVDAQVRDERGVDIIRQIRLEYPCIKLIAFSMDEQESTIIEMVQAGVSAYLLKDCTDQELCDAIRVAMTGGKYFSPSVSEILLRRHMPDQQGQRNRRGQFHLSKREHEIMGFVVREFSNQQIADQLSLSVRTVENHKRNMFQKMGIRNSVGMVRFALENHLL